MIKSVRKPRSVTPVTSRNNGRRAGTEGTTVPGTVLTSIKKAKMLLNRSKLTPPQKQALGGFKMDMITFSSTLPRGNNVKDIILGLAKSINTKLRK